MDEDRELPVRERIGMGKKQIHVLYIAHDANLYGSNQSLLYLIIELRMRHSVNPTVLVPGEGDFTRKLKEINVEYMVANYSLWQAVYKSAFRFAVKSVLRRMRNLAAWQQIKRVIKGKRYDLVHSNSSVVKIGAECAAYMKVPHIWHIREYGREDWGMRYMYSGRYVQKKYDAASALIAVSKGIEAKYKSRYPKCRICTIYNGIPSEKFSVRRRQDSNVINFCQVGNIAEAKNPIQVLEACKILKEEKKLNFVMNFIGDGDGAYYQDFLNYIEENELHPYINLWGFQENIERLLMQMDVGIIASRMEGFGRVTVEYMLSGMPVIGHASGGTLELVNDGETGFLYHTVEELVYYMFYFAQNPNKIEEMGKDGYMWAKEKFSAERNADLVYGVYQNTLERS